ncbi:MAG: flagellar export protein FliJ [Burkholderiaceae bacterium]|uniref:flagellar export protein FliJ n=1 Tax=Castellaniella sp. TaxID=1955812 RepID=UPI0035605418
MEKTQLDTLLRLKQEDCDQAGERLSALNARRTQAEAQLNQLNAYHQDYRERFQADAGHGLSAAKYANFHRFIATLEGAISQQNKAVAQLDGQVARQRQNWTAERRQLHAYETLQQRQTQQEAEQLQRREQREHDEIAARLLQAKAQER